MNDQILKPGPIMASAQQALADALAQLDDDTNGAFSVVTDGHHVQAVVTTRLGKHWQITAVAKASPDEKPEGFAAVRATW